MSQKESVLERAGQRQGQKQIPHVLAHSPKDNVAVVVVEGLKAGTDAFGVVTENDSTFKIDVKEEIPIGHKVALKDFKAGDTVIKYGQDVGKMVAAVKKGMHVHTQNMKTKRW
jgi:(2R)-sulfolactate sulfo-lyase subunit alpha